MKYLSYIGAVVVLVFGVVIASLEEPADLSFMLFTVGGWVLRLLDLECPRDHPQVVAAAAAMRRQLDALNGRPPEDPEEEGMMPFRALCLLGMADHPTMKAWGRELLDRMTARLAECHQWTRDMQRRSEAADLASRPPARKTPGWPYGFAMELNTLWAARDTMDVMEALTDGLNWIADNFDGPGQAPGVAFDEAWSMAMIPADNGHPDARRIALKLIPYLLRMQGADGGWGRHSAIAFRALLRQGLLGAQANRRSTSPGMARRSGSTTGPLARPAAYPPRMAQSSRRSSFPSIEDALPSAPGTVHCGCSQETPRTRRRRSSESTRQPGRPSRRSASPSRSATSPRSPRWQGES